MALGEKGTLFVGTRRLGNVYAIHHDGKKATQVVTIASGLNMPNGVAVKDGALYVAEVDKVWRYDAIESTLASPAKPVLVYGKYPEDRHHGWKFIRFGPDGWLYVPVGAPCNVCDREPPYADHAPQARRLGDGSVRARRAQQRRLRLGSGDEGALVHRQRPRHDGRRPALRTS